MKSSQKVTEFNQFVAVILAAEFGLGSGNAAHCEEIASCWTGRGRVAFGSAAVLRAPWVKLTVSRVFHSMSIFRVPQRSGPFRGAVLMLMAAMSLAGCASLPSSGPTGVEIRRAAMPQPGKLPFTMIEMQNAEQFPPPPAIPTSTLASMPPRPTDLLGPGDVLHISVYEAGVSFFGGALRASQMGGATTIDTSSSAREAASGPGRRLWLYQGTVRRAGSRSRPNSGRIAGK